MKTLLITGATDGLGLATARQLAGAGHHLIVHGRDPHKLAALADELAAHTRVETYVADLGDMQAVRYMATTLSATYPHIDALINNAGVYKAPQTDKHTIDIRFRVNTIAPYILTRALMNNLSGGRVINLCSAAQTPVNLAALHGLQQCHSPMDAYAQSKLALTTWTMAMANTATQKSQPADIQFIAINPGSLLATKMVQQGFGISGKDTGPAVTLLVSAAVGTAFATANGSYFDNDIGEFGRAHPEAYQPKQQQQLLELLELMTASS